MIGIKEIAKMANVSVSTVSNVINGRKNVGKETRERILQICAENNYSPNLIGRSLKSGKSDIVIFNFSDFDRRFYLEIINGISDYLTEIGYDLIICTNKSSKNFMRSNFAIGAISLDGGMKDETLQSIASKEFPIVVMDRELNHKNIRSILTDNYPVMCELIQALINKGYRNFAYIGGLEHTLDHKERYQAFLDTLEKNGIVFDKKQYFSGDYKEKSGYQAAKILVLGNSIPEVLVCANDNMAIGAMKAFKEYSVKVPDHVCVTGFDDGDLAELMNLTTVSIPRYEAGYLAAKELLLMLEGKSLPQPFKLNATIKWRKTVK